VHDVGEIEGRPYMAMELLVGHLACPRSWRRARPSPVHDVVVMGIQLARALDYAHGRGIVHRDIKPGNIMRLAGSRTIKVTDFGIAHIDDNAGGESSLRTRAGDVLGTPQYMSPEQTRGDKLDGRSDLFSAGIVLYQMIVGHGPSAATAWWRWPPRSPTRKRRRSTASAPTCPIRCAGWSTAAWPRARRSASRAVPSWPMRWSRCWPRSTRKREKATAAHRAAAREVGRDDGLDRRGGDGPDGHRDHAAQVAR
jgi:serine/threonine protein kinase